MKRIFVVVAVICFSASVSYSGESWIKTYGGTGYDHANSVQQTSDNGYIVAGRSQSFGAGGYDIWLLKLDSSGTVEWQKTYGGTGDEYLRSVQQTSDDGYIVASRTNSIVGAGGLDFWLLKLDSSGMVQWQKTYGGTEGDEVSSVAQTSDNGYIVAGGTASFRMCPMPCSDLWLLKLDSSGTVEWQKTYGDSICIDWHFYYAHSVEQTSDNGYIVAGSSMFNLGGNTARLLLKLDSSGTVEWQKTYGDLKRGEIAQTSDNGYIVVGVTDSFGAGDNDILLLKLDSSGTVEWQKTYGGTAWDDASSVQQTSDSGYIVAGHTSSFGVGEGDIWLLKLDSSGTVEWQKTYGGNSWEMASSVQQTSDSGYIVAGIMDYVGNDNGEYCLLKLDSSGNISECDMVGISDAVVTETTAIVENTNLTANNSSATINDTTILPQDTSCTETKVCPQIADADDDGILDAEDNCPNDYNPEQEDADVGGGDGRGDACDNCPNTPNPDQLDTYPPQGNNIGDACDCECDFTCDGDVDADDVTAFLFDFGREPSYNPCTNSRQCYGDFDCDVDVDADDVTIFIADFGREPSFKPCPPCVAGAWCVYE